MFKSKSFIFIRILTAFCMFSAEQKHRDHVFASVRLSVDLFVIKFSQKTTGLISPQNWGWVGRGPRKNPLSLVAD